MGMTKRDLDDWIQPEDRAEYEAYLDATQPNPPTDEDFARMLEAHLRANEVNA